VSIEIASEKEEKKTSDSLTSPIKGLKVNLRLLDICCSSAARVIGGMRRFTWKGREREKSK